MAERLDLQLWVLEGLRALNGSADIVAVSRWVWKNREAELRDSGDLFYTRQYDLRWAAQYLRNTGLLEPVGGDRRAPWTLSAEGRSFDLASGLVSLKKHSK
ncbi:hypothetical protein ACQUSY_02710 [Microbacterium sp. YY-03]|uniref:hypothetical protein n=1 Tax=Microbacterium sp. YY-03 TaxID=3421636 RepID=UPI003D163CCD